MPVTRAPGRTSSIERSSRRRQNLRSKTGLWLILHLGAKARDLPEGGLAIADPAGLLKWLGRDRAQIEFTSAADLAAKLPALQAVLRRWIKDV